MSRTGFLTLFGFWLLCSAAASRAQEISDPLEPVNRGIFWFNDKVDVYFLEPVARGYDAITPNRVQRSVGNFFENLRFPIRLVSDVIQFKFGQAGVHSARFLVNSTVGVAGLFDPASDWGLEPHYEDLGTALAYHGVPYGPYIVLPFLGPSSLRDGITRIIDIVFLDPVYYLRYTDMEDDTLWAVSSGVTALNVVNTRSEMLEAIESAKEASVDYYLFTQSAWFQVRQNQIYDNNPPEPEMDWEEEEDVPNDGQGAQPNQ